FPVMSPANSPAEANFTAGASEQAAPFTITETSVAVAEVPTGEGGAPIRLTDTRPRVSTVSVDSLPPGNPSTAYKLSMASRANTLEPVVDTPYMFCSGIGPVKPAA